MLRLWSEHHLLPQVPFLFLSSLSLYCIGTFVCTAKEVRDNNSCSGRPSGDSFLSRHHNCKGTNDCQCKSSDEKKGDKRYFVMGLWDTGEIAIQVQLGTIFEGETKIQKPMAEYTRLILVLLCGSLMEYRQHNTAVSETNRDCYNTTSYFPMLTAATTLRLVHCFLC